MSVVSWASADGAMPGVAEVAERTSASVKSRTLALLLHQILSEMPDLILFNQSCSGHLENTLETIPSLLALALPTWISPFAGSSAPPSSVAVFAGRALLDAT